LSILVALCSLCFVPCSFIFSPKKNTSGCNLIFFDVVIDFRNQLTTNYLTLKKIEIMEEILIPITFFICTFALIFGIRYFSNKEKMAMIERGIDPGVRKATPQPFLSLKFGLLLVGLGIGLLVALFTVRAIFGNDLTDGQGGQAVAIYFGFIGIFGGLGLITSYIIEKKWLDSQA
jgi:hypothetical protein